MVFEIRSPKSKAEFQRYYLLRWKLLREPWGEPRGSEKDKLEDQSYHLMALDDNKIPVAVARIHFNTLSKAQIRYMAVESGHQRRGIGSAMLRQLEQHAQEHGAMTIGLHARKASIGFYEEAGYSVIGPSHNLFGCISHTEMRKHLQENTD